MKFLFASSATGGHIYPALAVAAEIRRREPNAEILFVGATEEIGKDLVAAAGYPQILIDASGFIRKNPVRAAKSIRNFVRSGGQVRSILENFRPDIVFGTGGYVCGPVVREAKKAGLHVYLQEQNVVPGLANKFGDCYADKVFLGFEGAAKYFRDARKLLVTGNPVRAEFSNAIAQTEEIRARFQIKSDEQVVLIFGGSQGADAINAAGLKTASDIASSEKRRLFFITGARMYAPISSMLNEQLGKIPDAVHLIEYADAIWEYYAISDLIAARAGALTVSEIAACGKASILIPSPNVTNDHQYYNAKALADLGAARILRDAEISGDGLANSIRELLDDKPLLCQMSAAARGAAKHDATRRIVDELFGRS